MRNRMSGREIFGFDLCAATWTVEFNDANPVRIGREVKVPGNNGWVDLPRIAIVEQAAFLVGLARSPNDIGATIAQPSFAVEVEIEILRDPDASLLFRIHRFFLAARCFYKFMVKCGAVCRSRRCPSRESILPEPSRYCERLRAQRTLPNHCRVAKIPSDRSAQNHSCCPKRPDESPSMREMNPHPAKAAGGAGALASTFLLASE